MLNPTIQKFIKEEGFPTKHLSVSAIKEYMRNPRSFEMKYIRLQFNTGTWPSLIIGSSVHKAIEEYNRARIEKKAPPIMEDMQDEGIEHFDRLVEEQKYMAVAEVITEGWFGDIEIPIMRNFTNDEVHEKYESIRQEYKEIVEANPSIKTVIDEKIVSKVESKLNFGSYSEDELKEKLITAVWHAHQYLTNTQHNPMFAEIETLVEDGMPVPLKAILDAIVVNKDGELEIVDYKTVSKFSDLSESNGAYELPAWAYYYAFKQITGGKEPRRMRFVEILKEKPKVCLPSNPTKRLLQADLRALCDTYGIKYEKYTKNAELEEMLLDAGILETQNPIQEYIIDFQKEIHIMQIFLSLYEAVISKVIVDTMYGIPALPNISDMFTGGESYNDFVQDSIKEEDPITTWFWHNDSDTTTIR